VWFLNLLKNLSFFSFKKNQNFITMSESWAKFLAILMIIGLFFILSAILLGSWNYVIPALVGSINGTAAGNAVTAISYQVAMVFLILAVVLIGPGALARGIWDGMVTVGEDVKYHTRSRAAAYNTSPMTTNPATSSWGSQLHSKLNK
jgi:uncharacterized membrane protein